MKTTSRNLLKFILLIDGLIAIGFGLYSWLSPLHTYGTIISIPKTNNSLELAMLSSMSVSYILLGLVALIGVKARYPTRIWIGLLMVLRHTWFGTIKILDIGKEWLIGNPYPDIVIHSIFISIYVVALFLTFRNRKKSDKKTAHNV